MKKIFLDIFIIFFVATLLSLPLLKPGLYTMHDDQQIARLFLFDKALKAGQIPVRWVDGLGFGFGYPLFVFYPPFVYMLGEFFHIIGFGFINSIKLVFFFSIFASGLAMYFFIKDLTDRFSAFIAALFYMVVPYRALDVYVRGALAESFSFVFLPLILWSFYKLEKTKNIIYLISSSIFLALLMITHNLIFLPFMLILPLYLIFLFITSDNKKQSMIFYILSFTLTFALSAFFWIPAIFEKRFTIVDQLLLVNLASYKIHFVYPRQLWNWPWGFGGSAGLQSGISFKIGKLHILVSIAAFILGIVLYARNFRSKLSDVNFQLLPIVFFVLFLFSAFMTTFYSGFIWNLIPQLGYLQFPWRFLTFTALFSSILAGFFIFLLRIQILKIIAGLLLIALLVIPNFKLFKPQTYRLNLTDKTATSPQTINWDVSSSSFEYLPKGVPLYKGALGTNLVRITKNDIPKNPIEIIQGSASLENLQVTPSKIQFGVNAQTDTKIKANIFNFPTWTAKIDGNLTSISDNNYLKLINVDIPQGHHQVKIEFTNTPLRSLANIITLFSILFLILLPFKKWMIPKH